METELKPEYDNRKSFYKKAVVIIEGEVLKLKSYNTIVCKIEMKNNRAVVYGTYSKTTLRHIKEFLKQNGYKADSQRQILEDYATTEIKI